MNLMDKGIIVEEEEGFYYYDETLLFRVSISDHDAPAEGVIMFDVGIPIEQAFLIEPVGEDVDFDRCDGLQTWVLIKDKFSEPDPALREKLEREIRAAADRHGGLFAAAYGTLKTKLVERGSLKGAPKGWWDNEE